MKTLDASRAIAATIVTPPFFDIPTSTFTLATRLVVETNGVKGRDAA
jgi:hypothetical protein